MKPNLNITKAIKLICTFLAFSFILSCTPTKKAYKKGDYKMATFNAIKKLRKSPNNSKAQETLLSVYPLLIDFYTERVAFEKQSNNQHKWENIMNNYKVLQDAYNAIRRSPAALELISSPQSFNVQLTEATNNAAEERLTLGKQAMREAKKYNDRENAKLAHEHFKVVQQLKPNASNLANLLSESFELAMLDILVKNIPIHSQALKLSNEFFEKSD